MMTAVWIVVSILVGMLIGTFIAKKYGVRRDAVLPQQKVAAAVPTPVVDAQLLSAFDFLPIGVVISRTGSNNLLRNKIAREITGVRHVDVLVDEAVEVLVKETLAVGGQSKSFQVAGPPVRYFNLHAQKLDDVGVVVTIEDTTDRVRIDTVRTDFFANLSHELKTPIGGIAALGDTMMDETDPLVIRQLAERIVRESFRMAGIVDDLLDLSRIEFGRTSEWGRVDISSVVREVVALLTDNALRHNVELLVSGQSDVEVLGDRSQLVSAFSNLVENAIKYSEPNHSVKIIETFAQDFVSIAIIDQGLGIAPKDHERIFERFYRVDRARSRSTGGTGLGLSIVRHVVDNHGGKIQVQSHEGEGATFTVVLPRPKEMTHEPAN